jgi:hypothetical protein
MQADKIGFRCWFYTHNGTAPTTYTLGHLRAWSIGTWCGNICPFAIVEGDNGQVHSVDVTQLSFNMDAYDEKTKIAPSP